MNTILSNEIAFALSQTLMHSLWQILLIGIILFVCLQRTDQANAEKRYNISLAAIASIFVISLYTFLYFLQPLETNHITIEGSWMDFSHYVNQNAGQDINNRSSFIFWSEFVSNIWFVGFLMLVIRLIVGLIRLRFISSENSLESSSYLNDLTRRLIDHIGVNRKIEIYESNRIESPVTFGFFKSLILLPIGIVNQLTENELETIIAHELSHIARYDFLVNIFQSIIETLFYYHPVMWWISNTIKTERELCCDKVAIKFCDGETHYAQILVKLQELNLKGYPQLAMPFSSNQNIFSKRIKRILKMKNENLNLKDKLVAVLFVGSILVFFSFRNIENKNELNISPIKSILSYVDDARYDRIQNMPAMKLDTTPKKVEKRLDYNVKIQNMEEEIEFNFNENGLVKLKIDGKEIPRSEYDQYEEYINEYHVDINDKGSSFRLHIENDFPIHTGWFDSDFEKEIEALIESHVGNLDSLDNSRTFMEDSELSKEIRRRFPDITNRKFEWHSKNRKGERNENFKNHRLDIKRNSIIDSRTALELLENQKQSNNFHNGYRLLERDGKTIWQRDVRSNTHDVLTDDKPLNLLQREFNRDGLLEIGKYNEVELTLKYLKINGEKQPTNIHRKYMSLFVKKTGFPMTKKTKLEFQLMGRESIFSRAI